MNSKTELFKKELAALCKKYNCEIEASDHFTGYAECGKDIRIVVDFKSDYTVNPVYIGEELDLGDYFNEEKYMIF